MIDTIKVELFIDNADVKTTRYVEVRDPGRTADIVGLLAQGSGDDVDLAVRVAHRAYLSWGKTSLEERAALLLRAADIMKAEGSFVVELMARESGMLVGTNKAEIGMADNILRDTVEHAAKYLQPEVYEDEESWVSVEKRPMGVVAAIIPWNAPIILAMRKLGPALICGNTIVVKPAPTAPFGISILLKKMAEIFPPGVINVVHGGADVGTALSTHPLVRCVSFTGGGAVACSIMRNAASSIKKVQFELGGNDPAIILDDADLVDAVPKIVGGAFRRAGQFCFAVKRVYVHASLHDQVFEAMSAEIAKSKVGHPLATGVNFGPMNNAAQYRFIKDLTARTREAGAEVIELGTKIDPGCWEDGYYLLPAIVPHAAPMLEVVLSEQFGPIIPLVSYRSEEEVIAMANQTEFGLGSSIWSSDFEKAVNLSRRIEAGMTFVNQAGTSRLGQKNIPFGGVKQSGIGRESSPVGLAEFTEFHAINFHK